jgi:cytochrome P450
MSRRAPVTDWANDFDYLDPHWIEDPYPIWAELRRSCPVAHSARFEDGVYFPVRYQDIRAIAYDTMHFSSRRIVVRETRPEQVASSPPITSDPPEHRPARMVLLPAFTPAAIQRHEPRVRAICVERLDRLAGRAAADGAVDYAQEIPTRAIAHILGVPVEDGDRFRQWIQEILEDGITDLSIVRRAAEEIGAYFAAEIAERRAAPRDDLISYLLNAEIEGRPLGDMHVIGTVRLLLIAGIDTTWSAIGSCIWHLAQHPEDRRRLVAEPALIPTAVEEFLRAYSPVTMAREVVGETEISGYTYKPGQLVLLSFPAANRDPAQFTQADRVVIDRAENRHSAFGLGIHRCIGSNLARLEMIVALEEWLKRFPEFRLDPDRAVKWSEGTVRGPRRLPLLLG